MEKKYFIFSMIILLLASCGGGGSSGSNAGGGGTTPPQPAPISEPGKSFDPNKVSNDQLNKIFPNGDNFGYSISLNKGGNGWDLKIGELNYNMEATQIKNGTVTFKPQNLNGTNVKLIGITNEFVSIAAGIQTSNDNDTQLIFVPQGTQSENTPTGLQYYEGYYIAMDSSGRTLGRWHMEILIDYNDITQSYGVNTGKNKDIRIRFDDIANNQITGTISDPNQDNSLAQFALYGPRSNTLAGGYSSDVGAGLLVSENVGSPP